MLQSSIKHKDDRNHDSVNDQTLNVVKVVAKQELMGYIHFL